MMGERILVVEDDERLAAQIAEFLTSEGFRVTVAGDGPSGLSAWREGHPDLLVLDWMLPGRTGLDLMREIRRSAGTPIVMLTARTAETDKLIGLEMGADDYLTKPFSLRELAARIRAVLRRTTPATPGHPPEELQIGPLRIDLEGHAAFAGEQNLGLTGTEFKLLVTLARRPGRVYSRLQLMEAALGEYYDGYDRAIDTHISRLRTKVEIFGEHRLIQTVHGVGYKLIPPPDRR